MTQTIEPGIYKHYKGDTVEVIGMALESETLGEYVVYRHITGPKASETHYWVRPLTIFLKKAEQNGEMVERFVRIS
jgi:hypothetical protein